MTMEQLLHSQLFKQALFDVQNEECERLEAELAQNPVQISPALERRMQRLIRAERRPYARLINTSGKKAALALAAAFILMITMVFSVSAIREPVVRFFMEVYEKLSQVFYQQQEEELFPVSLEIYYEPAWLPEGYYEDPSRIVDVDVFYEKIYTSEAGDDILFNQYVITTATLAIDTEDVETKTIAVNGNEGLFYSNKEIQNILWSDGQYGFLISGSVPEDDLIRVAESLQPVKK